VAKENALPEIKGPGSAEELLKGQIALLKTVREKAEKGQNIKLPSKKVKALLTELKKKNPKAYKKVRRLSMPVQRKLFIGPIFAALGLGALGTALATAITPSLSSALGTGVGSALGTGVAAAAGIATGAALVGGAVLGAVGSRKDMLSRLKQEKMMMMGDVALAKMKFKQAVNDLNAKFLEIGNHVDNLSELTKSRINMLNLWIDSRSLI